MTLFITGILVIMMIAVGAIVVVGSIMLIKSVLVWGPGSSPGKSTKYNAALVQY